MVDHEQNLIELLENALQCKSVMKIIQNKVIKKAEQNGFNIESCLGTPLFHHKLGESVAKYLRENLGPHPPQQSSSVTSSSTSVKESPTSEKKKSNSFPTVKADSEIKELLFDLKRNSTAGKRMPRGSISDTSAMVKFWIDHMLEVSIDKRKMVFKLNQMRQEWLQNNTGGRSQFGREMRRKFREEFEVSWGVVVAANVTNYIKAWKTFQVDIRWGYKIQMVLDNLGDCNVNQLLSNGTHNWECLRKRGVTEDFVRDSIKEVWGAVEVRGDYDAAVFQNNQIAAEDPEIDENLYEENGVCGGDWTQPVHEVDKNAGEDEDVEGEDEDEEEEESEEVAEEHEDVEKDELVVEKVVVEDEEVDVVGVLDEGVIKSDLSEIVALHEGRKRKCLGLIEVYQKKRQKIVVTVNQ